MDEDNIVGAWISAEYTNDMQGDIGILSYLRKGF